MFSGITLRKTLVGFVCLGTRMLMRWTQLDKWEQLIANSCLAVVQTVGDHRARKKDDSCSDFLYTLLFGFLIHAGVYKVIDNM